MTNKRKPYKGKRAAKARKNKAKNRVFEFAQVSIYPLSRDIVKRIR